MNIFAHLWYDPAPFYWVRAEVSMSVGQWTLKSFHQGGEDRQRNDSVLREMRARQNIHNQRDLIMVLMDLGPRDNQYAEHIEEVLRHWEFKPDGKFKKYVQKKAPNFLKPTMQALSNNPNGVQLDVDDRERVALEIVRFAMRHGYALPLVAIECLGVTPMRLLNDVEDTSQSALRSLPIVNAIGMAKDAITGTPSEQLHNDLWMSFRHVRSVKINDQYCQILSADYVEYFIPLAHDLVMRKTKYDDKMVVQMRNDIHHIGRHNPSLACQLLLKVVVPYLSNSAPRDQYNEEVFRHMLEISDQVRVMDPVQSDSMISEHVLPYISNFPAEMEQLKARCLADTENEMQVPLVLWHGLNTGVVRDYMLDEYSPAARKIQSEVLATLPENTRADTATGLYLKLANGTQNVPQEKIENWARLLGQASNDFSQYEDLEKHQNPHVRNAFVAQCVIPRQADPQQSRRAMFARDFADNKALAYENWVLYRFDHEDLRWILTDAELNFFETILQPNRAGWRELIFRLCCKPPTEDCGQELEQFIVARFSQEELRLCEDVTRLDQLIAIFQIDKNPKFPLNVRDAIWSRHRELKPECENAGRGILSHQNFVEHFKDVFSIKGFEQMLWIYRQVPTVLNELPKDGAYRDKTNIFLRDFVKTWSTQEIRTNDIDFYYALWTGLKFDEDRLLQFVDDWIKANSPEAQKIFDGFLLPYCKLHQKLISDECIMALIARVTACKNGYALDHVIQVFEVDQSNLFKSVEDKWALWNTHRALLPTLPVEKNGILSDQDIAELLVRERTSEERKTLLTLYPLAYAVVSHELDLHGLVRLVNDVTAFPAESEDVRLSDNLVRLLLLKGLTVTPELLNKHRPLITEFHRFDRAFKAAEQGNRQILRAWIKKNPDEVRIWLDAKLALQGYAALDKVRWITPALMSGEGHVMMRMDEDNLALKALGEQDREFKHALLMYQSPKRQKTVSQEELAYEGMHKLIQDYASLWNVIFKLHWFRRYPSIMRAFLAKEKELIKADETQKTGKGFHDRLHRWLTEQGISDQELKIKYQFEYGSLGRRVAKIDKANEFNEGMKPLII